MREIKFRGKDEDDKHKWHYGFYTQFERPINEDMKYVIITEDSGYKKAMGVIPETVGQFTGLYDNTQWDELSTKEQQDFLDKQKSKQKWKGKEIYEHDLVQLSEYKQTFKVKFHDGSFILYDTLSDCNAFTLSEFKIKYLKLIVIDNPELLDINQQ